MEFKDDSYYIEKVLEGNTNQYAFLVDKHKNIAYTVAYRIVKNSEDAEEIAQDAFVKAYNSLKGFKKGAKFTTWLYRIIYNTSVSFLRKKRLNTFSLDELPHCDVPDVGECVDETFLRRRKRMLTKAIDELPDDDGFIVTLYYMNEIPIMEISEITGLSQSNIKVKLFRSRKRLSELLKAYMDDIYS